MGGDRMTPRGWRLDRRGASRRRSALASALLLKRMGRLQVTVVLALALGCAGYSQVVRASCGDGLLEPDTELCDDGAENGTDACCTTQCDFVDGDRDGICDAYDPCV